MAEEPCPIFFRRWYFESKIALGENVFEISVFDGVLFRVECNARIGGGEDGQIFCF